ncbi:hypothetical protein [Mycobacteroides abscessus]|uniref:hypothetical protein n=1 Tax=Mycobacteroides abscessus TaxID=36809 RepID=UPI00266B9B65|nr:hypothetical protein [Mycobacteroides abscessus]MDO3042119.1 hypothetical protein [Mycobacteroides abscessus subsp. abscessus]MDO3111552.1 hypothetical protein [Mycobacteroides abscessus subsp. massiliense]
MVEIWPLTPPELFPERARTLEDGGPAENNASRSRHTVDEDADTQVIGDRYQQGGHHD